MRKKEIMDRMWKEFDKFMFGQTVGLYDDGSTNYYEWDVERFLSGINRTHRL